MILRSIAARHQLHHRLLHRSCSYPLRLLPITYADVYSDVHNCEGTDQPSAISKNTMLTADGLQKGSIPSHAAPGELSFACRQFGMPVVYRCEIMNRRA